MNMYFTPCLDIAARRKNESAGGENCILHIGLRRLFLLFSIESETNNMFLTFVYTSCKMN